MSTAAWLAATALVALGVAGAVLVSRRVWTRPSRLRRWAGRATVGACTLAVAFLACEAYFKFLWLEPDGFGVSLHTRLWARRYLHPRNSLGYRDVEHDAASLEGKRVLFVVGDSFVEGAGLRDYRRRTSNVLARRLGPAWAVVNIAQGGWGTFQEHAAMVRYPRRPGAVVLVYYVNDVLPAAAEQGLPLEVPPTRGWVRAVAGSSYFLDFLYWRLYRLRLDEGALLEHLETCFDDPDVLRAHLAELDALVRWVEAREAELHVVVFPHLVALERTRRLTDRVVRFLTDRGVDVLDMGARLQGRDPAELVVGRFDSHPGEELNEEVAELLLERLSAPGDDRRGAR